MARARIIAGNWKMNTLPGEAEKLVKEVLDKGIPAGRRVIFCPPFTHLSSVCRAASGLEQVAVGGQNCHQEAKGAYTGEISAAMLKDLGCEYVILGHSERRAYFGETDQVIGAKVAAAIRNELHPIYCCGEQLEEREGGTYEAVVLSQLKAGLFDYLQPGEIDRVIIAYEPVWAIGTGKTASPAQAQEMHALLRNSVREKYGEEVAGKIIILYGGSCKPGNAKEIFSQPDVDGGLIGGAALNADDFHAIIAAG